MQTSPFTTGMLKYDKRPIIPTTPPKKKNDKKKTNHSAAVGVRTMKEKKRREGKVARVGYVGKGTQGGKKGSHADVTRVRPTAPFWSGH